MANELQIDETSVKNVTGRVGQKVSQSFDILSLAKVAQHLFSNLPFVRQLLSQAYFVYQGQEIKSPSSLLIENKVDNGYFFGANHSHAAVMCSIESKNIIICVLGANNEFHRDQIIINMKDDLLNKKREQISTSLNIDSPFKVNEAKINIFGDMYFGEFFSNRRMRKGRKDALTQYGYDYSFKNIQPLLKSGDFNIVNFEAALTNANQSMFDNVKPFVLGGNPDKSITTLQKHNIHAVTLGNNHTMDYGLEGLKDTIITFNKSSIFNFGAGVTDDQAETPLRLRVFDRNIVIYSAYWFRREIQYQYQYYAVGDNPGVASLNGMLLDKIKNEKRKNPDSFLIVIPHWGSEFKVVSDLQKRNANLLLESGVDLIIGHGSHMLQSIQKKQGKWIVFGLGNSIFNSDDEYDKQNVKPFSLLSQLVVTKKPSY